MVALHTRTTFPILWRRLAVLGYLTDLTRENLSSDISRQSRPVPLQPNPGCGALDTH